MQRQYSAFSPSDQQFEFDPPEFIEKSSFFEDDMSRFRLDSEYVWEGGEDDMYDDIVANTEPNLYYQTPYQNAKYVQRRPSYQYYES